MGNLPAPKNTQKPQETGQVKVAFKVYMYRGQAFFLCILPNNTTRGTAYKHFVTTCSESGGGHQHPLLDRKSTRLNSSHVRISYAVFCLKKKKNITSNI